MKAMICLDSFCESGKKQLDKSKQCSSHLSSLKPLLCSVCLFAITLCYSQGRNEGAKGRNSPGAESLCGRQITAGGAEKSQQCHKYFLQCSTFASERPHQVRTWGRQTCFLPRAPSSLVTSLALVCATVSK